MSQICVICCAPYNNESRHFSDSSRNDLSFQDEFQQAQEIFETFCEYLNISIPISSNNGQWDGLQKDPLPFCVSCKEIVEYMFQLHNQLKSIKNELKCCVENVQLKIEQNSSIEMNLSSELVHFRRILKSSVLATEPTNEEDARFVDNRKASTESNKMSDDDIDDDDFVLSDSGDRASDDDYRPRRKKSKRSSRTMASVSEDQDKKYVQRPRPVVKTSDGFSYEGHKFVQVSHGFKCCGCHNKVFKRKGGVLVHIRQVHLGEISRHVCDLCGRACDSPFALRNHRSTHSEERNFFCHCGKAFKNAKNLKRHIVETHKMKVTDEVLKMMKPLEEPEPPLTTNNCDRCGRGFDEENDLQVHKETHKGEKYFKCFYCQTNYLQQENFQRHLLNDHSITVSESTAKVQS